MAVAIGLIVVMATGLAGAIDRCGRGICRAPEGVRSVAQRAMSSTMEDLARSVLLCDFAGRADDLVSSLSIATREPVAITRMRSRVLALKC